MSTHSDKLTDCDTSCWVDVVDSSAVARAKAAQSDGDVVDRATAAFSALSDPTRFRILEALISGDLCVCDIAAVAGVTQSAASHQLRILRDRGLVAFRRDGQRAVYRLVDDHVRDMVAIGLEHARERR